MPDQFTSQVDAILSRMTLEQKIGQILVVGFDGTTLAPDLYQMVVKGHIGGVIIFDRNIASVRALAQLIFDLQGTAQQNNEPGLIISVDQEGGLVTRLRKEKGFTEFPGAMVVAATGEIENARRIARAMATEMKAVGINTNLAPVLDVNNNPQNSVIGIRSYSSDPSRVAAFGVAFIEALQAEGIIAIGKHFPGHGDTKMDSHFALPMVSHNRARLEEVELVPFKAAMKAGVAGIMPAHITFPGIDPTSGLPATFVPEVLTGLIRNEMQYSGLVITDALEMGAVSSSGYVSSVAAAKALEAGADMLILNKGYELTCQTIEIIKDWIKRGQISEARLNEAVQRVLVAKRHFGILWPKPTDVEVSTNLVGTVEHKMLSQNIAAQAITLLRDEAHLLPLHVNRKLLVIEMSTTDGLGQALGVAATSVIVSLQPTELEIEMVVALAQKSHCAIVTTANVSKHKRQADLVKALLAIGIPTVVVALFQPYDLMFFPEVCTYLTTYGSTILSFQPLADVLAGIAKPQGHLPVELPGLYSPEY